ncbi:hypothetical protein [Gordonia alkanivorans]|uniref:hypothetical protein n=1 Tax=Gordonia alkanivorans TaxID=84096 RepID=UPI001F4D7F80|nr:hypothetical protein [Gordonia alkanivorans]
MGILAELEVEFGEVAVVLTDRDCQPSGCPHGAQPIPAVEVDDVGVGRRAGDTQTPCLCQVAVGEVLGLGVGRMRCQPEPGIVPENRVGIAGGEDHFAAGAVPRVEARPCLGGRRILGAELQQLDGGGKPCRVEVRHLGETIDHRLE